MSLNKKPGPILTSEFFGELNQIPPEFRAKIGVRRLAQENPIDVEPDDLVGQIIQSQVVQERTDERLKTTFEFIDNIAQELDDEVFIKETCQIGHRARKLVPEGTDLPAANCLLWSADQHNLGNGLLDQNIVTVDELFQEFDYTRERPVVTPQDFRAQLQEFEQSALVCGTGVAPPAFSSGDGLMMQRVHQVDECKYRATQRIIDQLDLPLHIQNSRSNRYKQVETVDRWLLDDITTPTLPTAVRDVTFTKLGDGTALEERVSTDSLFENLTSSTEIADALPDIFKVLLPSYEREFNVENDTVDDPPTLATGDFYRSETQFDVFNKKVRTRGRAGISLPQDIVVMRRLGGMEFGGEHMKLTGYLDSLEPAVEEGLGVLSSEVRNLGNGTYFRQTEKWDTATEWPTLVGTETDPRTGIAVGIEKKVVIAGTTGGIIAGNYVDVKPLDKWRSIQITSTLDPSSLPDPKTWETTVEHRFPDELLDIAWIWAAASAPFAFDFDMVPIMNIRQGYAGPCRAKITESFSIGPPADVVSPTIFCPQGHTIGYAWFFAADPSADCGTCIGIARAQARTWPVPPTLHDVIDLTGTVTIGPDGQFTDTLPATTPTALPAPGTLITKACDVEEWRFNVFYRRLVEIYVPDCS